VLLAGAFVSVAAATSYMPLSVAIQGSGAVRLSNGASITCARASCPAGPAIAVPSHVTLVATPAHGWKLVGWRGACHGGKPRCVLAPTRPTHVGATFATTAVLGTKTHPVPIGQAFNIADGWRLKVVSVTPDATQAVLAVTDQAGDANIAPPPGAQDFLVLVEATYTAGGSGNPYSLLTNLDAEGAHNAVYTNGENGCGSLPSPALGYSDSNVFSGQTVSGNICWQIASNDAASLALFVGSGFTHSTWFALH
jgi:hypothetical protein